MLLTFCGVNVVFAIDGLRLDSQGLWLVRLGFSLGWGEVNGVEKDHRLWVTQLTLLSLNSGWMDAGVIPLVAQIKSGQKNWVFGFYKFWYPIHLFKINERYNDILFGAN